MINLYITSYHQGDKKGIYCLCYDENSNTCNTIQHYPTHDYPSYAIKEDNVLYISLKDATQHKTGGGIQAYTIDDTTLTLLHDYQSNGVSYTHLTCTKNKQLLLGANFHGGSVDVFNLHPTISLKQSFKIDGSAIHYVGTTNTTAYAVDLSNHNIYSYSMIHDALTNLSTTPIENQQGPRHLYINELKQRVYLINEIANRVHVYTIEKDTLILQQELSLLPTNTTPSLAAAIKPSPCGQYLFVSNRGADCISVLSIQKDGLLSFLYNFPCGKTPRDLFITSKHLFVACQDDSTIEIYCYNETTLKKINTINNILNPVCITG